MRTSLPKSDFAPAERVDSSVVERQKAALSEAAFLPALLDAMPLMVVVLNPSRQIVMCNKAFRDALPPEEAAAVLGRRPGEALGCARSRETAGGCGTTRSCARCGLLRAALAALNGSPACETCVLERSSGRRGLRAGVWASPLAVGGEDFAVLVLAEPAARGPRVRHAD
ncbi:MAG: hypothetical protein HY924_07440 [Elusimicrobia bacterium]|nr:hypothetical protein [Elusimicrobiota bacterium]